MMTRRQGQAGTVAYSIDKHERLESLEVLANLYRPRGSDSRSMLTVRGR